MQQATYCCVETVPAAVAEIARMSGIGCMNAYRVQ